MEGANLGRQLGVRRWGSASALVSNRSRPQQRSAGEQQAENALRLWNRGGSGTADVGAGGECCHEVARIEFLITIPVAIHPLRVERNVVLILTDGKDQDEVG